MPQLLTLLSLILLFLELFCCSLGFGKKSITISKTGKTLAEQCKAEPQTIGDNFLEIVLLRRAIKNLENKLGVKTIFGS